MSCVPFHNRHWNSRPLCERQNMTICHLQHLPLAIVLVEELSQPQRDNKNVMITRNFQPRGIAGLYYRICYFFREVDAHRTELLLIVDQHHHLHCWCVLRWCSFFTLCAEPQNPSRRVYLPRSLLSNSKTVQPVRKQCAPLTAYTQCFQQPDVRCNICKI